MKDALKAFIDYLALNRHLSPHSVRAYTSDVEQYLAHAAAARAAKVSSLRYPDLDADSVRGFVIELNRAQQSRASVARKLSGAFWGAVLLCAAIGFGVAYRPLETSLNALGMAIEKRMTDKTPDGAAYGRYVHIPSGVILLLMLPLVGWGVYKLADGIIGETELIITTASGELRKCGRGRREDLLDFGAEVGRGAGR